MLEVDDDREEGNIVASRIRLRRRAGIPLSDMAVLFRTTRQGRNIERALVRSRTEHLPAHLFCTVACDSARFAAQGSDHVDLIMSTMSYTLY